MIDILTNESFLALACIYAIAALGMNVVYVTGQLSLGQAGFFAIGAYAVGVSNAELGLALVPSLALAAVAAAVVALPVAAACSRLHGVYLVMGTLAIGELVRVAVGNVRALGGVEGYTGMEPVGNGAIYAVLVVCVAITVALMASSLGLRMRSLFDDEESAAAAGVPTRLVKALAVIIGAALVAIAGGLFGRSLLFISPADFGVSVSFSIALFTLIGGVHSVLGALVGAFGITALLELLRRVEDIDWVPAAFDFLGPWRLVVFGALVMLAMALAPDGLIGRSAALRLLRPLKRLRRSVVGGDGRAADASSDGEATRTGLPMRPQSAAPASRPEPGAPAADGEPVLVAEGVRRTFGSVVALDDVSITVRPREILAVIGANGAGKSTLLDVIAGRYRLEDGSIRLHGKDIAALRPEARTRIGLSRTFQSVRVFSHLTVEESLRLGRAAAHGRQAPTIAELLELTELTARRDDLSGTLTLGEQRRLEIGRALASAPDVLLLDEPSAGMIDAERAQLAELIERARARGIAVVLVDHNLDLALGLADRVAVLDFGRLLTVTTPDRVLGDERVRAAYLGSAEVELA